MRKIYVTIIATIVMIFGTHARAEQPALEHITITVEGNGPDVVLIPGLASPRDVYAHEAALLAPHYRLHLVQVNGFGTQPAGANANGPVLQPVVDDLHSYIVAEHLKHPAVIGHSLGGLAAMMLSIQHPDDAGRLLIVDSLPFIGLLFSPDATVSATQQQAAAMRDRMLHESQEQYAAGEQMSVTRLVRDPEQRRIATAWASASNPRVVAQAMYDDFTTDLRPELSRIKVPVTVLYPRDSTLGADRGHDLYAKAFASLPQVKIIPIDKSYHFIMLDQPGAFHQAVLAFLK